MTHFFEGLIDGLKTYEDDRSAFFANGSWKFSRDAIFTVLLNFALRQPDVDLSDAFRKLPAGTDTSTAVKVVGPLADKVLRVPRV